MTGDRNTPRPSPAVEQALEAGWAPTCDGAVALCEFHYARDVGGPEHRFLDVRAGERRIQVAVSPAGRSVRIYVDGTEVKP